MPENGLWYNPFLRIYSLGATERLAEISCSPRVKEDKTPHVYTEDTPFTINENDYNFKGKYPKDTYLPASQKFIDHGVEHIRYGFKDPPGKFVLMSEIPEEDLILEEGYLDSQLKLHKKAQPAVHFKGDHLPGAFPKWIPETEMTQAPDAPEYVYPVVPEAFIGELVRLAIDNAWVELDSNKTYLTKPELAALPTQFASGEIKLPYKGILNIQYQRIIR